MHDVRSMEGEIGSSSLYGCFKAMEMMGSLPDGNQFEISISGGGWSINISGPSGARSTALLKFHSDCRWEIFGSSFTTLMKPEIKARPTKRKFWSNNKEDWVQVVYFKFVEQLEHATDHDGDDDDDDDPSFVYIRFYVGI